MGKAKICLCEGKLAGVYLSQASKAARAWSKARCCLPAHGPPLLQGVFPRAAPAAPALLLCPSTLLQVRFRGCLPARGPALMWGKPLPTLHAMVNCAILRSFSCRSSSTDVPGKLQGLSLSLQLRFNELSAKSPLLFSPFLL